VQDKLPVTFYGIEKDFGSFPMFAIGGTCIVTSFFAFVGVILSHSRRAVTLALGAYLVRTSV
jgi:hypothetical protein